MTSLVLSNNAQSILTASIAVSATTITVATGQGARFPNPTSNQWFPLSLITADGSNCEIVRATARNGDVITIVRAQEDTTAVPLVAGDIVAHQMTAAAYLALAGSSTSSAASYTSGSSAAYVLSDRNVNELVDGLAVTFIPHVNSVSNSTLKINNLVTVPIRKRLNNGAGALVGITPGNLLMNVQAFLTYDAGSNAFVLSNPSEVPTALATELTAGLAQRAPSTSGFDLAGDNQSFVTEKSASKIAGEAFAELSQELSQNIVPFIWRNTGSGAGGALVITNGGTAARSCGRPHEFRTIELSAGGILNIVGAGVCVLRCTESIILDGEINFPVGSSAYPNTVFGPTGSSHVAHPDSNRQQVNAFAAVHPGALRPNNDVANSVDGIRSTADIITKGILEGYSLEAFQGGNGTSYNESFDPNCRGGLILIAPSIELGDNLIVNAMHPPHQDTFQGGNLRAGPGGGGLLMLVTEDHSIDGAAMFEAHDASTTGTTDNHRTVAQMATVGPVAPAPTQGGVVQSNTARVGGNGQLFVVNRNTAVVTEIF